MDRYNYSTGNPPFGGVVRILIILNVILFFAELSPLGEMIISLFGLTPIAVLKGQVWRLLTYGFLHSPASPFHVAFNMLGLWMFGTSIEMRWGSKRFLTFYLFSVIFSGLFSLLYLALGTSPMIIGASGGLLGVLTLYAIFYPEHQLLLFFVIPVKARVATIIFAIISIAGTVSGRGGVAHLTHLGGIAAAFLYLKLEPFVIAFIEEKAVRKEKRKNETTVHYFESRKSRLEENAEKDAIDEVLAKISRSGMESLTEEEYKILEKASGKPVTRK
jgi:membrane associated rhomboid family serine protease